MIVPLLILLVAGGLRLVRIDQPARLAFDERHYVPDAREYLDQGVEVERPAHPPAGKWLMAGSMRVAGDRPIGWRLAPAVAGLVVVGAAYFMGLRLLRAAWAAALAALLVALDGLALTMSRIAMLDGIQAGFIALGALFVLRDRDATHLRWRIAAGVALGGAVAVKWSSVSVLALAVLVALVSDLWGAPWRLRAAGRALVRVVGPLVVLPAAVYVASYAGWFANVEDSETGRERCGDDGCSVTEVVSGWVFEQWDMWAFQGRLIISHDDRSDPPAWLTMAHPVLFYAEGCPQAPSADDDCRVAPGTRARILGVGNPALWWAALPAYPYLVWAALRRRRAEAALVVAFVAVQVLPWFASPHPGFAFYLTPVVPFVALAVTMALDDAAARWRAARALPLVLGLAAVGLAVWFYPIWTGWELTPDALDSRLWFPAWR